MSSPRDLLAPAAVCVAIVALVGASFALGWWIGRSGAQSEHHEARIAALEQRLGVGALERAAGPKPPAASAARPRVAEVDLDGVPMRGPAGAAVTLVEFSDFECPYCGKVTPLLDRLRREFPEQLRVGFKHFPLSMHRQSRLAHRASVAAGEQGKFWEMHDRIFAQQRQLDRAALTGHAAALGLDVAKFEQALDSPEVDQRVQADIDEGQRIGVRGTPTFVLNGQVFSGALPYESFKAKIEQALPPKG